MAEATGQITALVLVAGEARTVGVAARSAHAMTANAQLLARASVATGARRGIDARLDAMFSIGPAGRVRIDCRRPGDLLARVAVDAGTLGVACGAQARIGARFLGMASHEASTMEP